MFMNVIFYIKLNVRVFFVLSWVKEYVFFIYILNLKIKGVIFFVLDFIKEYD